MIDILLIPFIFVFTFCVHIIRLVYDSILNWVGYKPNYWPSRKIDGPPYKFLIGNYFSHIQPHTDTQMEFIRKYGNVFGAFIFNEPVLVVSNPLVIERILAKNFNCFTDRSVRSTNKYLALNLVHLRGAEWKRVRSIASRIFTTAKLKKMEPLITDCIDSLMVTFEPLTKEKTDLLVFETMANFTMDIFAKCAFAVNTNLYEDPDNQFVRNAQRLFSCEGNFVNQLPNFFLPQSVINYLNSIEPFWQDSSRKFFADLARHLIRGKKETNELGYENMIRLMQNATWQKNVTVDNADIDSHHGNKTAQSSIDTVTLTGKETKLTEDEMVAQCSIFLLAGYDTAALAMTYCFYELAMNPDIQKRLYEEIENAKGQDSALSYETLHKLPYLDAVIMETLRHHPSLMFFDRQCTADVEIPELDNYTIKRGDIVMFPVYGIHHQKDFYEEPNRFNPDRFMPENKAKLTPFTYLAFGAGSRNCVATRFAYMEIKLALAHILHQFEITKTAKTPEQLKYVVNFLVLKSEPIYVGIKKRNPSLKHKK